MNGLTIGAGVAQQVMRASMKSPARGVKFHDGQVDNLTDSQLRAIGLIVTNWSSAEHVCALAVTHLLKADPLAGTIATSKMQSRTLVETFRLLALAAFPSHEKQIQKMYKRLGEALEIRNEVAHAYWSATLNRYFGEIDSATAEVRRVKALKNGVRRAQKQKLTTHQLRRQSLFIHGVTWTLLRFMQDHQLMGFPSPSHKFTELRS